MSSGGTGEIKFTLTADGRRLENVLARQQKQIERLQAKMRGMASASARAGRSQQTMFQQGIAGAAKMAAGYATLQMAISNVNQAIQEEIRLQQIATRSESSVAAGQAAILSNLVGQGTQAQKVAIAAQVGELSRTTGIQEGLLATQASELISATSGDFETRAALVMDVLEKAAPFFRTKPEESGAFAGAVVDVQRSLGGAGVDEALALMLVAQSQARITSIEELKNLAPALVAADVTSTDDDPVKTAKLAAAIFAAVGARMGDPEGATTKTAVAGLISVLEQRIPKELGLTNLEERLAYAISHPEFTKKEIIPHLIGRAATKPILRELLEGGETFAAVGAVNQALLSGLTGKDIEAERQFIASGTKELERDTRNRIIAAENDKLNRGLRAGKGAAYERLFGGTERVEIGSLEAKGTDLFGRQLGKGIYIGLTEAAQVKGETAEQVVEALDETGELDAVRGLRMIPGLGSIISALQGATEVVQSVNSQTRAIAAQSQVNAQTEQ